MNEKLQTRDETSRLYINSLPLDTKVSYSEVRYVKKQTMSNRRTSPTVLTVGQLQANTEQQRRSHTIIAVSHGKHGFFNIKYKHLFRFYI